jgi:hypothetical protein
LKNALQAFNNNGVQLVTAMAGLEVGWNGTGALTDTHANTADTFWTVLKDQGVIAGPTHA